MFYCSRKIVAFLARSKGCGLFVVFIVVSSFSSYGNRHLPMSKVPMKYQFGYGLHGDEKRAGQARGAVCSSPARSRSLSIEVL